MRFISPLITVKDIRNSRHFYEEILGQQVKFDLGKNITFEGDFAIHLREHFQELIGETPIREGGNNFELYFETDDMTTLLEQLQSNEVKLAHELREQPWRQQVVRFYDPDGHLIEVGETMQHLCERLKLEGHTEEEVQQITGLPMEFVEFVFSMNDEWE